MSCEKQRYTGYPEKGVAVIVLSAAEALERASHDLVTMAVTRALVAAADGSGRVNPVVIGQGPHEGEVFSVKSGSAGRIVGLKVGSYWPGNSALGLPRHGSSILLLDPDTGGLMAVVDASPLNGLRTAAADAVAALALARSDAATLTVVGAGHQAEYEIRALCAVLPLKRVLVASRNRTTAAKLRDRLRADLRVDISVVDIQAGCQQADILVTVTPSRMPLFDAEWIKPGTHVATMGSDQVGKQELPIELLHAARLFCDLPEQSLSIGEFQHVRTQVASGELAVTAIGDVLRGRADGRRSPLETTIFDSSGLALQDLFVASAVMEARRKLPQPAPPAHGV